MDFVTLQKYHLQHSLFTAPKRCIISVFLTSQNFIIFFACLLSYCWLSSSFLFPNNLLCIVFLCKLFSRICQSCNLNLLSLKESQDVQESFKHLEAWYDENVSRSWPRQLLRVVLQQHLGFSTFVSKRFFPLFLSLGVSYWSKSLSRPVKWRHQVAHQHLCLNFLIPGWKVALW